MIIIQLEQIFSLVVISILIGREKSYPPRKINRVFNRIRFLDYGMTALMEFNL